MGSGKYAAQIKESFFSKWDDIFISGVDGLIKYSEYKYGRHNNRHLNTLKEAKEIIKKYKEMLDNKKYKVILENL